MDKGINKQDINNENNENMKLAELIKEKLLSGAPRLKLNYDAFAVERGFVANESNNACYPQIWRCIDGRDEEAGFLRYPGASLGMLFTVLPVAYYYVNTKSFSAEDDIKELLEIYQESFGSPSMHTDEHAMHANEELLCAGCGHIKKNIAKSIIDAKDAAAKIKGMQYDALPNSAQPGTLSVFAQYVNSIAFNLLELDNPDKHKNVLVLKGEHNEGAILIIHGKDSTLAPRTKLVEGDKEYSAFVFHKDAALEAMFNILDLLLTKFSGRKLGEARNVFFDVHNLEDLSASNAKIMLELLMSRQLADTTKALGVESLPVIEVSEGEK